MFKSRAALTAVVASVFLLVLVPNATTLRGAFVAYGDAGIHDPSRHPHEPPRIQEPSKPQVLKRSVQISLSVEADLLIENSDGKRLGVDFKSRQFVNEIPESRAIAGEGSSTYVLPFDQSGKPYLISITGTSTSKPNADLTMTGPGFVVGFKGLGLKNGEVQKITMASNGTCLAFIAVQEGQTPRIFLTTQSGAGKPSYRFEVIAASLASSRTISVKLDLGRGRLDFKTDDPKKTTFDVMMRRTNPGGTRETYNHHDVSFGQANSYAMDFSQWDGRGDVCFFETCDMCPNQRCTKQRNEFSPR